VTNKYLGSPGFKMATTGQNRGVKYAADSNNKQAFTIQAPITQNAPAREDNPQFH